MSIEMPLPARPAKPKLNDKQIAEKASKIVRRALEDARNSSRESSHGEDLEHETATGGSGALKPPNMIIAAAADEPEDKK